VTNPGCFLNASVNFGAAAMNWKDVPQIVFYIVGAIFSAFSIYSIYRARRQYRVSLRQRTAQSLMELEERVAELKEVLPLIDPESNRYDLELRPAVEKSIQKLDQLKRSEDDRAKMILLDRFLRFLLLLTAMQEYELLKPDALRYMYWYWFRAVSENSHLKSYIDSYFPTLAAALEKEPIALPPDDSDKRFEKESFINSSPERVFEFHEAPDALKQLTPPWINAKVVKAARISELGSKTVLELRFLGVIKISWEAQHTSYQRGRAFTDVQIKGPFSRWHHRHTVRPDGAGARLKDEISYRPPFGWFGRMLTPLIERRLKRLFDYRHEVTRKSCEETEEGRKDIVHA